MSGLLRGLIDRTNAAAPALPNRSERSKTNYEALRLRLRYLVDVKEKKQIEILKEAGLHSDFDKRFSEWLRIPAEWEILNHEQYRKLVNYLIKEGLWQTSEFGKLTNMVEHSLYYSLLEFLDIRSITENNMKERAPGLYKMYRPSLLIPDRYVVGALYIWVDKVSKSLRTYELQKFTGKDGSPPKIEQYHGYLVRKSKKYVILARDNTMSSLQVTFMPDFLREEKEITVFIGVTMGLLGAKTYTARFYAERHNGNADELEATLDLSEDVPLMAKAALNGGFESRGINIF